MASLKTEHQRFIVIELARGSSPSEIVAAVKEEFGLDVSRQQVRHYNPVQNPECGKPWRELFEVTCAQDEVDIAAIPVSRQSVRLRRLQQLIYQARERKAPKLEAALLEQVAQEVGGSYTNRRELTGRDGKDLPPGATVTFYIPDNGRDTKRDDGDSPAGGVSDGVSVESG